MEKDIFTQFMLFVGFSWLLMICMVGLQVLAHLWGAVCSTWTLNGVARDSLCSWPFQPSLHHVLPCTILTSLSHPIRMAQAWPPSSVHWTHGKCMAPCHSKFTLLLLFPSSFPSTFSSGRQSPRSHMRLSSSASMSGAPENNSTIFFSRELSISAA